MAQSKNLFWTWSIKGLGAIEKALLDLIEERYPITPHAVDAMEDAIDRLNSILRDMRALLDQNK